MPLPLDDERPEPPPPRRPGTARYWLWYYGGPRYVLACGVVGAIALVVGAGQADVLVGVSAGVMTFATGLRLRPGRREW